MDPKAELLLADVDESTRVLCTRIAEDMDCRVVTATDQESVLSSFERNEIGVVLIDAATISAYLDLIKTIKKTSVRVEVLIADERADIPKAIAAIKAGATDYLEKPLEENVLESALSKALQKYRNFEAAVVPLDELERRAIEDAIAQANGDKLKAASLLSIGKTTLYRKLKQYGGRTEPRVRRSGT